MKELVEEINKLMDSFMEDAQLNLQKGVKAASRRARTTSLVLAEKLKEYRKVSVESSK